MYLEGKLQLNEIYTSVYLKDQWDGVLCSLYLLYCQVTLYTWQCNKQRPLRTASRWSL